MSWDAGRKWYLFGLGLPDVAVYDLAFDTVDNDLVVATHGRSLWVLDDLTPFQDYGPHTAASALTLFHPGDALRFWLASPIGWIGDETFYGQNPDYGASFSYYLSKVAREPGELDITDSSGKVVRTMKGLHAGTTEQGPVGPAQETEGVIAAVGVVGNVENLGLEKLGVKTERAAIVVDGVGKTNVPGIYAIGDVAGPPLLAHKAEHEGVICVEAIKGLNPHPINKRFIPGCTYCTPQIASVGLTEQAAKEQKIDIRVGRFPFVGNGKAIALGEDQGLVKVIFDKKTGQLLGAHMVGAEVTELIQGYVVAMNLETTEEELMHTVFPHPTLSEMMKEAVLDAYGRVLNI